MKMFILAACLMAALAGTVYAGESIDVDPKWGFGWDSGLTLRRNIGLWQVGVAAGPNDYLVDSDENAFDSDLPDSLQGLPSEKGVSRRESGYVRVYVGRQLKEFHTLKFQGKISGSYTWEDSKYENYYYYFDDEYEPYSRHDIREDFVENWRLGLGFRLSWFPIKNLSISQDFGLSYRWEDSKESYTRYDSRSDDFRREVEVGREQSFNSFGPNNLTYGLEIVVWF